jgi:hypothetical protein
MGEVWVWEGWFYCVHDPMSTRISWVGGSV